MPEVNDHTRSTNKGYTISNYIMHCHCCKKLIHRGDMITKCVEYGGHYSMTLRPRTVINGGGFYIPETGARWIHKLCQPQSGWTDWTSKCYYDTYYRVEDEHSITQNKVNNYDNWKDGYHDGYPYNYLDDWEIY